MPNQFSSKLRELREKKGVQLRRVAAALDVDQSLLSKYERGERLPNEAFVKKVAKYFSFDANELLALLISERFLSQVGDSSLAAKALKIAEKSIKYGLRRLSNNE
jgi:transcriptional regulator with XRE-family HTH domain